MTIRTCVRTAFTRHPFAVDTAIAVVVFAGTLLIRHPDASTGTATPTGVTVFVACLSLVLVFRRRWTVAVLAVTAIGTGVAVVVADGGPVYSAAVALATYAVAARADGRGMVAVPLAAAVMIAASVLTPESRSLTSAGGLLVWIVVPAAVGYAVRSQRAYLVAVQDRAVRAEQTRQEEAGRQVAEERLRIARELHDVVAHHVAVVSMQAGLAGHLLLRRPEQAQKAMRQVQVSSATILDELGGILRVLRQGDAPESDRPAPGLDQLDTLAASYAAAGLRVRYAITGEPRPLSDTVDLVAYRVVEESLTNAHKHGRGTAEVEIRYTPTVVTVGITNPTSPDPTTGRPTATPTGYGLTGMHERARAVGATLTAGPSGPDQFRVELALPCEVGS